MSTTLADSSSIFTQEDSWGRFKATKESFQKVLARHAVFSPFLDCIHGFGFKTEEDHKIWDGYHASLSSNGQYGTHYSGLSSHSAMANDSS